MMEHNQLDLVYLLDRSRYSDRWEKVMEVPEPVMFVASPRFHLADRKEIYLDELLEEPFLLTEPGRKLPKGAGSVSGIQGKVADSFFRNQQHRVHYTDGAKQGDYLSSLFLQCTKMRKKSCRSQRPRI